LKLPDAVSWFVKISLSQSPVLMVPVGVVLLVETAAPPLADWNSTLLLPRMRAEMNEKPVLKPVDVGEQEPDLERFVAGAQARNGRYIFGHRMCQPVGEIDRDGV